MFGYTEYSQENVPGVYLETKFNLPRRPQFMTAVPLFIGLVKSGPKHADLARKQAASVSEKEKRAAEDRRYAPHMLSLWSQFRLHVGEPDQDCTLAYAVRGFFQNGGRRCYVLALKDRSTQSLLDALDMAGKLHTIDLVCLPDPVQNRDEAFERQQLVVNHCETMGDRFAILDCWGSDDKDGHKEDGIEGVAKQWSEIDGNNGAIYYPWIEVRGFEGGMRKVPPCGHIAGVYARTDHSRGLHKAPANEVLEGVVKLAQPVSNADQTFLNPRRVNCLREFPGRGIRVWGARTLANHDTWTYVNVRRLFLTAVRWINWHMAGLVFEPNDAKLWARIERALNAYFLSQYRRGALKGRTPQEAYYVRCNAQTNPPELRDLGQVVTEIGLAPANPYEFVVVRLIHGASGVNISGPTRPEQNL